MRLGHLANSMTEGGNAYGQFIVRDLEEAVKTQLKRRAARHGRSMEDEVRHILRDTVKEQNHDITKLGSRIAARFLKKGLTVDLPELHALLRETLFGSWPPLVPS